jgi:hypothetical protein
LHPTRLGITADKMATVGTLANLAVEVKDSATGAAIKDVGLRVKAIALEYNLTMFAYQGFPNSEERLKRTIF